MRSCCVQGDNERLLVTRWTCTPGYRIDHLRKLAFGQSECLIRDYQAMASHQTRPRLRTNVLEPNGVSAGCLPVATSRCLPSRSSQRFDLWEEVAGRSFFTTSSQHRALREGVTLAKRIGQTSSVAGYSTQAGNVLCFLHVSVFDYRPSLRSLI